MPPRERPQPRSISVDELQGILSEVEALLRESPDPTFDVKRKWVQRFCRRIGSHHGGLLLRLINLCVGASREATPARAELPQIIQIVNSLPVTNHNHHDACTVIDPVDASVRQEAGRDLIGATARTNGSSATVGEVERVLAAARKALEKLALPARDKDEVTDDLGKLTAELGKPVLEPSRIARYLAHIRDVAPEVEQVLTANEHILTGRQMEALRDALCDAFDGDSFDQMLRLRLNKDRAQLVADAGFRTVAFRVIDVAHREGWVPELVAVAASTNPGNPALKKFCAEHPHLVRTGAT